MRIRLLPGMTHAEGKRPHMHNDKNEMTCWLTPYIECCQLQPTTSLAPHLRASHQDPGPPPSHPPPMAGWRGLLGRRVRLHDPPRHLVHGSHRRLHQRLDLGRAQGKAKQDKETNSSQAGQQHVCCVAAHGGHGSAAPAPCVQHLVAASVLRTHHTSGTCAYAHTMVPNPIHQRASSTHPHPGTCAQSRLYMKIDAK